MNDPSRFERWMTGDDGRLRKGRLAIVLVAAYVVFTATYIPVNLFSVGRDARTLGLPGEDRIPFLPIFEYFYVLSYFVGPLLYFTVRDYATLRRLLMSTALVLLTGYATYLVYPVYLERPALEVTSLHTWLLSIEYLDKPYNHFPSMHVALSWLAVLVSQVSRRSRWVLALLATGISVSTVLVKQHYIVDVIYGLGLAWVAWRVTGTEGRTDQVTSG